MHALRRTRLSERSVGVTPTELFSSKESIGASDDIGMDVGGTFAAAYHSASYDTDELAIIIGSVRELRLLGSGIYSQ